MFFLKKFAQVIHSITHFLKWIAYISTFVMMLLVTVAVIFRNINLPIVGDYELVQVLMVCVIVFSLPYVQYKEEHVSVRLLLDKFPKKIQTIFDRVIYLIVFIVCLVVGYIVFQNSYNDFVEVRKTSDLLYIPFYPFKFGISFAFVLWALQSLLSFLKSMGILVEEKEEN